ncbi:AraC family transcriptional regulator [Planotetraspora phitsanulokensis]|uniref:AraC family transcriptional regulator n=1 Tax=Planotetraspora phitsanulokensis TaxID=575192 RepID=A0A8J3UDM9_9ACTN|nr:AraC family transcriptional regulator [Planotetraspora phitsanulokensis]GII41401.1 AraC family transcriptional regulator [Planotetraspora phitsanulokensis]
MDDTNPFKSLDLDQSAFTERTFCSWYDTGWRSVLLRRYDDHLVAEDVYLPPTDDQHLVLVTAGESTIESFGEGGRRKARYVPGQIGLTPPGVPTRLRWRSEASPRTLHLHLPDRLLTRAARELWGTEDSPLSRPDALALSDPVVAQVMLALDTAAATGMDDLYADSAAHFLAVHLLTRHCGMPVPRLPRREDTRVRRAIEIMRDGLHHPLTLTDIASQVWLSTFHFVRVFKAATGETPHRYLTRLRIQEACRHLERGTGSISEIAQLCGFSSPSHLSAAFAREVGTSPSAYRRDVQERDQRVDTHDQ